MSNSSRIGTLIILIAAVLLFLFASGFLLNVLRSDLGIFVTTMSVLAFGAAVLAVIVSFTLYRRAKSVG